MNPAKSSSCDEIGRTCAGIAKKNANVLKIQSASCKLNLKWCRDNLVELEKSWRVSLQLQTSVSIEPTTGLGKVEKSVTHKKAPMVIRIRQHWVSCTRLQVSILRPKFIAREAEQAMLPARLLPRSLEGSWVRRSSRARRVRASAGPSWWGHPLLPWVEFVCRSPCSQVKSTASPKNKRHTQVWPSAYICTYLKYFP